MTLINIKHGTGMQFGTESKLGSGGWKAMIEFPSQQRYSSWVGKGRESREAPGSGLLLVCEAPSPVESLTGPGLPLF